jgi:hypothetical protein
MPLDPAGTDTVPVSLRRWFVVHCVADLLVAVPLFVAPRTMLGVLGWTEIDPAMSRVVAAALFGIGMQSFLGRNEPRTTFAAMLTLKVIWSTCSVLGLLISVFQGAPPLVWGFLATFAVFSALWWRYWLLLRRVPA